MRFALALQSDDGVKYGVTVPDLPDCFSAGETLDEAIELHCEGAYEEGMALPVPRPLVAHKLDPLLADAVWAFVEVDVERFFSRPMRLNVSLPESLVRKIDAYAKSHHLSRSGFLARAAEEAMQGH